MRHQLHVINGSHPCATVLRALELKGMDVGLTEYLPPLHPPLLRLRFGYPHVPVLVLDGGEVVHGSRPILQRLEAIQPDPPLYPRDRLPAIEEAERWGDEELQVAARRLLWTGVAGAPASLASFQAGSRLPSMPRLVVRLFAPLVVAGERRLNDITPERVAAHAEALPAMLDQLSHFHELGAFGDALPTAADLQIGASLQLLRAVDDLRPLVDAHPVAREVARWLPPSPGRVPAGALGPEIVGIVSRA